jgi:hypothetical protein
MNVLLEARKSNSDEHVYGKHNYPLAKEVARGYSNASVRHNPCEHSRINILQWILTKLGTYLVLTKVWNPIDLCRFRQYFCLCHTCAFPSAKNFAHAQTLYRIGSLCRSRNI